MSAPRRWFAAVAFGAALGLGAWYAARSTLPVEPATLPELRDPVIGPRLFDQVSQVIAERYVDTLGADSMYRLAVEGLLEELGDPYSTFLAPRRLERLSRRMAGNYVGIGATVDQRDGWTTVVEPLPGGPAERAGLIAGDRIIAVDGESTEGLAGDEVPRLIRGPSGSKVTFTIDRLGVGRLDVTLERGSVARRAVPRIALMTEAVGYVDVNLFSESTADEVAQAVDSVVRLGARSLLLDFRGNPGGLLDAGVAVAELFLDPGQTIVELRGRTPVPERAIDTAPQRWPTLPIAVLIDDGSASASEIVAGALQDHDRAVIIGRTTFGKGSAQTVFPMAGGGALRLTTARWYTPLGRSISKPLPPTDDEATGEAQTPPDTTRPRFETPLGRTVVGGGGIVPDLSVGDSIAPERLLALARALGQEAPLYRDAVARYALTLAREGQVTSPEQPVTREMLETLYRALQERGVSLPRPTFDAAGPWVARALGYEMTRVTFGPDAEFRRRAKDDAVIARGIALMRGTSSPRDAFARVQAQQGRRDVVAKTD